MIKKIFSRFLSDEFKWRYYSIYANFIRSTKRKYYTRSGRHSELFGPLLLDPQFIELDNYTRLSPRTQVISAGGKVVVKKYTAFGPDCILVPGSHVPTVGLPQFMSRTHINDTATTIVIEEDVWLGARCMLLSHAHIGRGAVLGAGSLITKKVPPYAVVAGSPARIIAVRFSLEQILAHESILYPPEERMKRSELEELFHTQYAGLKTIGTSEISPADLERLKQRKRELGIPDYENAE